MKLTYKDETFNIERLDFGIFQIESVIVDIHTLSSTVLETCLHIQNLSLFPWNEHYIGDVYPDREEMLQHIALFYYLQFKR